MKDRDGQYIEMGWDSEVGFEIVRGWVGEEQTRRVVEANAGNDGTRQWTFRECYAANLQTDSSRSNGYVSEIRIFDEPGRGRYKVSALIPRTLPANCEATTTARRGDDDCGKWRRCELPAGHTGEHKTTYCGHDYCWPNRLIGVSGHEGEVRGAAPESLAR